MGLNPEYIRYFMVPEEKVRPRCPVHGTLMEDGDPVSEPFFCVQCVDDRRVKTVRPDCPNCGGLDSMCNGGTFPCEPF